MTAEGGSSAPGAVPAAIEMNEEPRFSTWTGKARGWMLRRLPPEKLLPENQPSYVASWIYVFAMGAIAALVYIIGSGCILALNGPAWYHVSGLLLQTNFDSQWIAYQAKDALNAVGVGAWFNVANLGQILMWHITLLPLAVAGVVALHVVLVRMHGVVPPLDAAATDAQLQQDLRGSPSGEGEDK